MIAAKELAAEIEKKLLSAPSTSVLVLREIRKNASQKIKLLDRRIVMETALALEKNLTQRRKGAKVKPKKHVIHRRSPRRDLNSVFLIFVVFCDDLIFVVFGIFHGYSDLSFYLCVFASLREILNSSVAACRRLQNGRHSKIYRFLSANSSCRVRRKSRTFCMFSDDQ
jgi:hypothetical protein